MSGFCQPAGAEQAEGIELSLSAKGPGSVQQSPTIAGRSEAPLRKQVSLKARYYQSAESGSAPALLELDREGHSLAGTESKSESLWRGQIQPVSAGSALLPEIREAAVSQESTQSGASPKHHGIFWQQMQRDANQLSGSQVKVLPSLREATADAQDRHAEAAASRSSTGATYDRLSHPWNLQLDTCCVAMTAQSLEQVIRCQTKVCDGMFTCSMHSCMLH